MTLVGVLVDVRAARPVRGLPRGHRRARERGRREAGARLRQDPPQPAAARRGARRLRAHQRPRSRSRTCCSSTARAPTTSSTSSSSRCRSILAARYLCFIPFGLYRGVWRFAGARDAAAIVVAVIVSEVVAFGIVWFTSRTFGDFPRAIFVLDALIVHGARSAPRASPSARRVRAHATFRDRHERRRTLLVGAGRSGRSLLRELRETPGEQVVGFVDDDPRLRGRRMQGVPVLGTLREIDRVARASLAPDLVLVTIPDAPRDGSTRWCKPASRPAYPAASCAGTSTSTRVVAMGAAVE